MPFSSIKIHMLSSHFARVSILKFKHFAKYPRFAFGYLFSYHAAFKTLEMPSQTT